MLVEHKIPILRLLSKGGEKMDHIIFENTKGVPKSIYFLPGKTSISKIQHDRFS